MRGRLRHIVWVALLGFAAAGCDFRPLADMNNVSYVRVYVDEHILNVTEGFYNPDFQHPAYVRPDIFRVALYDAGSGDLVTERYLRHQGDDERGHYYDGYLIVDPGTYHFSAWNFGTETTIVGKEKQFFEADAYTREIYTRNRSGNESIRYDADHLFVADRQDIVIQRHETIDTLRNENGDPFFLARSVVKSYYLQIGIKGSQWLSSATSLLNGVAADVRLYDRSLGEEGEATLAFGMTRGKLQDAEDHACIYTTFGTFGRLEGTPSDLRVTFEVVTTYGQRFEVTIPMDEVWLTQDALEHQWLIIDQEIEIPEPPPAPGGGGMDPGVEDWGDIESDIVI